LITEQEVKDQLEILNNTKPSGPDGVAEVIVFCFVQKFFFGQHENQNIFFSNIGNQNIFGKKQYPPPFQVKCPLIAVIKLELPIILDCN
jgi:hypothetical protein